MIPERSYEIPFELKRSVPTHISREVLLHITGFTSDQRIEQKFSFLMTDKASVKNLSKIKKRSVANAARGVCEADPELARRQPKAVRSACEWNEHVP